ncbi:MAG: DUF3048 domain-containing protein [Chloroflexota bacterium]
MKTRMILLFILAFLFVACSPAEETPDPGITPLPTAELTESPPATATIPPTPESTYPAEGYGPTGFPAQVNPLTGLPVADPALLERRPIAIKISNLPRYVRPQWGLSLADIVYEYYTEEGTTRFVAIFLGNDAEVVGPIRSARFFDAHIIRGYKAIFAFGSAYDKVLERLYGSEFANRLVVEGPNTPLRRYDPNGYNHLVVNTAELSGYISSLGVANGHQNLDGMFFQIQPPPDGLPGTTLTVRYSGAIYNRWSYDPESGRYLRFHDVADDLTGGQNEQYEQATDRSTGEPLAFDNVVILQVQHEYYNVDPEVIDILFYGSGTAYAFRDGQAYRLTWQRSAGDAVVSLAYEDGTPFPFRPGTTWFEVVGAYSQVQQTGQEWRVTFHIP